MKAHSLHLSVAEPAAGSLLPALRRRLKSLPEIGQESLILLASLFFTLACNRAFWNSLFDDCLARSAASAAGYALAVAVALTAVQFFFIALFANRWTIKPLLAVLILIAAFASHYMSRFGVYLDPGMLRNVLRTDVAEARELLTFDLFVHVLLRVLPALALLAVLRVRRRRLPRALGVRTLALLLALLAAGSALGLVFKDFSAQMRNHKELRYLATPANALYSTAKVLGADARVATREKRPIGRDAVLGARWRGEHKPMLFVLVVGETVRAQNWGLNGGRQTTPELAQRDVINFGEVSSCGSNTEVSVPCMFSQQGRRRYDEDEIRGSESLLNVLQHAGLAVRWEDNQSGCKGVCDGVESRRPDSAAYPELCAGERCLDEVLVRDTETLLQHTNGLQRDAGGNLVLVLHQLGNHGPAYFKRYPPAFRRFVPTCDSEELSRCSREEISNSYDNALLYTDHVLAQLIDLLHGREDQLDSALLYVSDHGESLGEKGLFLHGVPYAIAPREQTQVPMLLWMSSGYAGRFGIDAACVRDKAGEAQSHDKLFHTVLGMLDVDTTARDATMDFTASCRRS